MSLNDRLPTPLSERLASASAALYSRQGREFDVAIGGIPFLLATTPDLPQTVETIPIRKEQFDAELDPGEQSLSGWWRRSQASFHGGAGYLYAEGDNNDAATGFWDSEGVDVFSRRGQVTLLRKMVKTLGGSVHSIPNLTRLRTYSSSYTRTNLCPNPSFEVDTSGWTAGNGGNAADTPTLTRVDPDAEGIGPAPSGGYVLKCAWDTDDATGFPPSVDFPSVSIGASTTFTATVQAYVPTGSTAVGMIGHSTFGTGTGTTKDQWVECTLTATTSGSGNTQCVFWPSTPVSPGEVFYLDAAIMELGTYTGQYFDGDSPGAAWDGADHASSSTYTVESAEPSKSAIGNGELYTAPTYDSTSWASLHNPATTLVDGIVSGGSFVSIASDGTLYQGDVSAPGSATTWPCGATPSRMGWGKHRLWVIGGRKLWQPDLSLSGGSSQDPIFTHPNGGFNYTCMTEGPSAMYFGGHDGFSSTIQAVTLEEGGGLPTLSGATVTAVLPDGELVQELATVAGQYIGIGTNMGFRVGVVQPGNANIIYGPLIVEPEGVVRCTAMCSQGRYFLVAFETEEPDGVVYKIDTGIEVEDGVFPYCKDVQVDDSVSVTGLAIAGTSVLALSNDGEPWHQSRTELVESGWIQSGRVRFRTTEFKAFKYLDVEIEPLKGSIQCEVILDNQTTYQAGSITREDELFTEAFAISGLDSMRYVSPKFTLVRSSSDSTLGPTLLSYLLRAQPAARVQRMFTLPLLCFDREQSRSGQRYGGVGYARDRVTAMQILEDAAETLIYQDFSSMEEGGRIVMIEKMRFVRTAPPSPHAQEGAGGILVIELRTVEA